MTLSAQLAQYVISGITIGCIYALVAIGFNIIFNATGIINLAQGEFVMLGAMIMVLFANFHLPLVIAFFLSIIIVGIVGGLFQRLVINPVRNESMAVMVFVTLGVSILLCGSVMFILGKDPYRLPAMIGSEPISFLGTAIHPQYLVVIGVTLIVVVLLTLFFEKTILGQAIKACSINRMAASLMGISPQKTIFFSFVLSAVIGAIAGIVIGPITMMEYDRGPMLCLKGFAAAVLGGLGSIHGAVLAGLMIGLLESFGAGYVSSSYKDALGLIVLLAVLFWKPSGLFGLTEEREI
jgi:branched-chain amino acid transport system permease protein